MRVRCVRRTTQVGGALAPRRRLLPSPLSPFVGRARELESLRGVPPTTRLLTLTGPGGVGKTRLALELLRSSVDSTHAGDGVVAVELGGLVDASLIEPSVASALGL